VREISITSTLNVAPAKTKDGPVQLQAFSVSSQREGNSKAIAAQRKDMNIITSVSSDIFGEVMDGNVGEFLKYLPGVDLEYVESEPRGPRLAAAARPHAPRVSRVFPSPVWSLSKSTALPARRTMPTSQPARSI
jgi:hypothetical protein